MIAEKTDLPKREVKLTNIRFMDELSSSEDWRIQLIFKFHLFFYISFIFKNLIILKILTK